MSALNDCLRIINGKVFPDKRLTMIFALAIETLNTKITNLERDLAKPKPKSKSKPRKKVDPYSHSGEGL